MAGGVTWSPCSDVNHHLAVNTVRALPTAPISFSAFLSSLFASRTAMGPRVQPYTLLPAHL
jgi:hypothetical protein